MSISIGASSKASADDWLYLPVAGPIIDLAARANDNCHRSPIFSTGSGTTQTTEICVDDSGNRFLLTFDALVQGAGLTMLIVGLAAQQQVLVRDFATVSKAPRNSFAWSVSPRAMGRGGYGLGIGGTF